MAELLASTMPSEKKTIRSPGWVERVNSSYSALGKRPRGKPSAWMVLTLTLPLGGGGVAVGFVRPVLVEGGGVLTTETKRGWTEPAFAICRVWLESSQTAISIVTYWESSLRSCSWSLSAASMAAG